MSKKTLEERYEEKTVSKALRDARLVTEAHTPGTWGMKQFIEGYDLKTGSLTRIFIGIVPIPTAN
jgi:hypothetical protein